jgi:hypothetical protein
MGEIEVSDWEAKALVDGRHAEYVDQPLIHRGWDVLRAPDPDFENKLRHSQDDESNEPEQFSRDEDDEPEDIDDDFDRRDDDFDRDEEVTPVVKPMKRPVTTDSKAEWVKWAVQNGAEEAHSLEMTKAQLVAKFGKL